MVKVKTGDLLQAEETIIAHQVNCFGAAGGLAYHVFKKWPMAEVEYQRLIALAQAKGGLSTLLGIAQSTGRQPDGKIIVNLYGQYHPGQDFRPTYLRLALENLAGFAKFMNASVAMPYGISCGICGGDWKVVRQMIEETMEGVEATLYRLG